MAAATPSGRSKIPMIASVVVIVILAGGLGYVYVTTTSTIANQSNSLSSFNGQISSLQGAISSLNSNLTHQVSAKDGLKTRLGAANQTITTLSGVSSSQSSTIASLQSALISQSSEISGLQSTLNVQVQQTIVSNQNFNMAVNSTIPVTHFTSTYGGYLQISGSANTRIVIVVCYGALSQSACDVSTTYYLIDFGTGGSFDAPLMPGSIWVSMYNRLAGTVTLNVVEWV